MSIICQEITVNNYEENKNEESNNNSGFLKLKEIRKGKVHKK